ncbi:phosphonate C-P lyase system protein PhnL [Ferrovibrio terrae]|uniref:Phosphonate C-P lyase system protein PhnL n=1 Tax=Ferrovibrio terrae TaxID=2594003 RepID=A0A516H150_9PROT|nr:phosphonate C-P lyase system protein PhnL [Ferrovibrio terrae]QDO97498.1 phosphonate C-P lyase system protein PhnL [Ferrovibrio terrae]
MTEMIKVESLDKTFTLHLRGGIALPVLRNTGFSVNAGECVTLHGPSGAGKSTLLRSIYGNYRPQAGRILIRHDGAPVDIVPAEPRVVLEIRRRTLGYVTQFLRVIPRVATLDIVAEPMLARGAGEQAARARAAELLARLQIAEKMWSLPPATFSGGEQQRINIARGFCADYPILLLDEPTASLDETNRKIVINLIDDARQRGTAIVAIVHDADTRAAITTRLLPLESQGVAA